MTEREKIATIARDPAHRRRKSSRWIAWSVHLYTASGAVIAFAGTLAVFEGRYRDAFLLMLAATLIDATDGLFARAARVKDLTPGFDGSRLDDIVDYLGYVFLPCLLLYHAGDLPSSWGWAAVASVLLSSAFGFGAADAKTDDHFFTGFPSYWNIVALYLHAARLPVEVNAIVLVALSALVFVRIGYIYPSRTPTFRTLTIGFGLVWGVMMVLVILDLPDVPPPLLAGSLLFPVYYVVLSVYLHAGRGRRLN